MMKVAALIGATCMTLGFCVESFKTSGSKNAEAGVLYAQKDYSIDSQVEKFYDENVVFKLPENVSENQEISVIVSLNSGAIINSYNENGGETSLTKYAQSREGKKIASNAAREQKK
ncbi:MAG: hypothetical protein J6K50_01745, partial [Clostridia bacterium]|nr:hypothetical protein [Clostridia bacterium]